MNSGYLHPRVFLVLSGLGVLMTGLLDIGHPKGTSIFMSVTGGLVIPTRCKMDLLRFMKPNPSLRHPCVPYPLSPSLPSFLLGPTQVDLITLGL